MKSGGGSRGFLIGLFFGFLITTTFFYLSSKGFLGSWGFASSSTKATIELTSLYNAKDNRPGSVVVTPPVVDKLASSAKSSTLSRQATGITPTNPTGDSRRIPKRLPGDGKVRPIQAIESTIGQQVFSPGQEFPSQKVVQSIEPNAGAVKQQTPWESVQRDFKSLFDWKSLNGPPLNFTSGVDKQLLREQCRHKYGQRTYLPETLKRLPPMLYTFPGAGNTWCRLLIEHSTGIYTGSVYDDASLLEPLPGEFKCNWLVSAIKVHPHTHHFSELHGGHFASDNNKCNKGNIRRFERVIIVLRDPYDSIWSEFQRRITQSHVSGVRKDRFNWHRWQANAASLAHAYFDMWELEHMSIERQLKPEDILYIRYEDLKNKKTRVEALRKVAVFLRFPADVPDERLECAFVLADNRQAHRTIDDSMMTKDLAYRPEIACRMWSLFGHYALRHNYKSWNNYDCTGYPKIPRINVGPQGEYDRKWVRPGQKMIDFRGNVTEEQRRQEEHNVAEGLREEKERHRRERFGPKRGPKRGPNKRSGNDKMNNLMARIQEHQAQVDKVGSRL